MKQTVYVLGWCCLAFFGACTPNNSLKNDATTAVVTYCNPIDLDYVISIDGEQRREAADPTMLVVGDTYYMFVSKSGGYWQSTNLKDWTHVATTDLPTEDYAPCAVLIDEEIYYMGSSHGLNKVYRAIDINVGKWEEVATIEQPAWDPAFLLDDDHRLYLYWGCSDTSPLYGVEIDYKNGFKNIGNPVELNYPNPTDLGWEVPGDYNTRKEQAPWIEGPWVDKRNGVYYLQYAGPGTEYKSYGDAVYTSNSPLGEFKLQASNPMVYKPGGFANGAGHGSTFKDKVGNYWHICTISISVRHMFERRLALYPVFFDEDGEIYADTRFGDFPRIIPQMRSNDPADYRTNWNLLSHDVAVEVSSAMENHEAENLVNEDIRTYWAPAEADEQAYVKLDLGDSAVVKAVQLNFAEHDMSGMKRFQSTSAAFELMGTDDAGKEVFSHRWTAERTDNTHIYYELPEAVQARHLMLKNFNLPKGQLALSGVRVFGCANGEKPQAPTDFKVERQEDRREVKLSWNAVKNATGYNIRYGVSAEKLYQTYSVFDADTLTIRSLNSHQNYVFCIEAFNASGCSVLSPEF
ncbi:MAG: family 43 glycosylhydrolase [Mangrovibacterium sp.]